jgi:hypothetical protein
VPALLDFIRLYHADDGPVPPVHDGEPINDRSLPEQEAINSALELAVQAVAQLGTPADRRWLDYLARDPNTMPPVQGAFAHTATSPQAGAQAGTDAITGAGPNATGDQGLPPPRVTREMIQDAFAPVRDQMLRCLDNATSRPSQLRLQFRYDGTGAISNVAVVPAQYASCIAPIAAGVRLPASQTSREIGTYYLLGEVP